MSARPRDPRRAPLRSGLLLAALLSLVAHGGALAVLDRLHFGVEPGDSDARLSLCGTGARGEPGGGDGIEITMRRASGATGEPDTAPRAVTGDASREVEVVAKAPERSESDASSIVSAPPAPGATPRVEDDVALPAIISASDTAATNDATTMPVATSGEWEGPPLSDGWPLVASGAKEGADGAASAGHGNASGADGGRGVAEGVGVGPGPGGANGNGVLAPNPLAGNAPPDYPLESRRAGEEGLVLVRAHVAADGSVSAVEVAVSSGHERLDSAALDAVAAWVFEPARRAGQPIAQVVDVPIRFTLQPR